MTTKQRFIYGWNGPHSISWYCARPFPPDRTGLRLKDYTPQELAWLEYLSPNERVRAALKTFRK